jgi:hypothetical protein
MPFFLPEVVSFLTIADYLPSSIVSASWLAGSPTQPSNPEHNKQHRVEKAGEGPHKFPSMSWNHVL